jgi:AcrR family transcriptional regulator
MAGFGEPDEETSVANVETSKGVYHAHRDRQRRLLLSTARTLFAKHGIERVTLADIVTAAGLTRSTIYQYFANKDDLVWALCQEILEHPMPGTLPALQDSARSAYEKIAALLAGMGDQLVNDPDAVRFMSQFDYLYARDWSADRMLALEALLFPGPLRELLAGLVREGIADGSLRLDLDPEVTLHALMNAAVATQRRLASMPAHIEAEYGQPADRLFRETCRILLEGIKSGDV